MEVTPSALQAINRSFNFEFQAAVSAAASTTYWQKKARQMPSTGFENVYSWVLGLPDMRRWVGPRIVRSMEGRVYILRNEPWELTWGVDRRHVEYNQIGQYADRARMGGDSAARWKDKLVTDVQLANPIAFDGQNFYDTDHPRGSTVYANYHPSTDLTNDNLWAMAMIMMGYLDDFGESLGVRPTILEVPPQLSKKGVDALKALQIVQLVKNVAGDQNVAAAAVPNNIGQLFDIELVINERLSSRPDEWYLHSTNRMPPFVVQAPKEPSGVTSLTNPSDPNVFWQREFIYGIDADGAAGVTLPFLSLKAKVGA